MSSSRKPRPNPAAHAPGPSPTFEDLARLAAQQQVQPIIIGLDNCSLQVGDIQTNHGAQKQLRFIHASGGVVFHALIPSKAAKELGTALSAPPGIVLPQADTPAA